jgi:hypothetical protein
MELSGLARSPAARHVLKIDVAVDVPYEEVSPESGRCAAKSHFDAAYVVVGIELQVADFRRVDTLYEVVVFLL